MSNIIGFPQGAKGNTPPIMSVPLLGQQMPSLYVVDFEKLEDKVAKENYKDAISDILKLLRLVLPIFPVPVKDEENWQKGEINSLCRKLTEDEIEDLKQRSREMGR